MKLLSEVVLHNSDILMQTNKLSNGYKPVLDSTSCAAVLKQTPPSRENDFKHSEHTPTSEQILQLITSHETEHHNISITFTSTGLFKR